MNRFLHLKEALDTLVANFWNTHLNSVPMEVWRPKPPGERRVLPRELQPATEEEALFHHFTQNRENWLKWARLKQAYPTDMFGQVLEQRYLAQLSFKVVRMHACVYTHSYVDIDSNVSQLETKKFCVNILERFLETEFSPCFCQSMPGAELQIG